MHRGIRIATLLIAAVVFAAAFWHTSTAQRRAPAAGRGSGGLFQHATAEHKKTDCASCHKISTPASARFPDVTSYPYHPSCYGCHSVTSSYGGKLMCAVCHASSKPTKRSTGMFGFPLRSRPTQFATIFPHNAHQDIIASLDRPVPAHFVNISFSADDKKAPDDFNNCSICHETTPKLPKYSDRGLLRKLTPLTDKVLDIFEKGKEITPDFFKDSPEGHISCFNCHYQSQKPVRTECASCHRLTPASPRNEGIARFSLRFNHKDPDHVNRDCIVCHVRIAGTADLRAMKEADVPIFGCSTTACHGDELATELKQREDTVAAKKPAFQCVYCHTSEIGRYPVPVSHLKK